MVALVTPPSNRRAADVARKEAVARRNQAKTIADQADEDIARFEALRLANHERMTQAIKVWTGFI